MKDINIRSPLSKAKKMGFMKGSPSKSKRSSKPFSHHKTRLKKR